MFANVVPSARIASHAPLPLAKRIALAAVLGISLAVSGCSGDSGDGGDPWATEETPAPTAEDITAAVDKACDALQAGDWEALDEADDDESLLGVTAVGPTPQWPRNNDLFADRLSNTKLYADAYMLRDYSLHNQLVATDESAWTPGLGADGWTRADAEKEGKDTFDAAWQTCAENATGFPDKVDTYLEANVMLGAVIKYSGPTG